MWAIFSIYDTKKVFLSFVNNTLTLYCIFNFSEYQTNIHIQYSEFVINNAFYQYNRIMYNFCSYDLFKYTKNKYRNKYVLVAYYTRMYSTYNCTN